MGVCGDVDSDGMVVVLTLDTYNYLIAIILSITTVYTITVSQENTDACVSAKPARPRT